MKKRSAKKDLAGDNPFPGHHRVMKGEPANRMKKGKIKHSSSSHFGNSHVRTGMVKGPLAVKGKHKTSRKRVMVKA